MKNNGPILLPISIPKRCGPVKEVRAVDLYKQIGSRIRRAREALGYSQEELGQLLGYSATAIYYFENGIRKVKIEDLKRIAEILEKPIEYFLQEEPEDELTAILWRATQELPPAALHQLDDFLQALGKEELPSARIPDLSGLKPFAASRKLLEETGFTKPAIPVDKVAEALGIAVRPWAFIDDVSAVLVRSSRFTAIAVNENHPETRKRFSIAHEIGHAVLGHAESLYIEFASSFQDPSPQRLEHEREANWFAADLLMPAESLREDYKRFKGDVARLAEYYEVSQQAMWVRLQALHLVKEASL